MVQDLAFILSTFYVSSSILLMGFFVRLDQIRVPLMKWFSYLVFPRYAYIQTSLPGTRPLER